MNRDKQIEEMAAALRFCKDTTIEYCHSEVDCKHCLAKQIYNAGYRKQIEGKWSTRLYSQMDRLDTYLHTCSECNYFYKNIRPEGYNYCPNCGAKMMEADEC